MNVATSRSQVGIRELKNNLSKHIERVRAGDEIVVTDHGVPVARLSGLDAEHDRLAELVKSGLVVAPTSQHRHVPRRRIPTSGSVTDLVSEQRR